MCLGRNTVNDLLRFYGVDLKDSEPETVIGIEIDNFEGHIKTLFC